MEPVLRSDPGKTEEEQEPELHYSVQKLLAIDPVPTKISFVVVANNKSDWQHFN